VRSHNAIGRHLTHVLRPSYGRETTGREGCGGVRLSGCRNFELELVAAS
jgi:hypothetical protein